MLCDVYLCYANIVLLWEVIVALLHMTYGIYILKFTSHDKINLDGILCFF